MVRRPYQRAAGHAVKYHLAAYAGELNELGGRQIALDRQMMRARCQILANGDHIAIVCTQIVHHRMHLLQVLAEADHEARLGGDVGMALLETLDLFERSLIDRAGARHPEIPAVVLLSPGMQLWQISINNAIDDYGSRPIFLVSAEQDEYPAMTVGQLAERAQSQYELLLIPGAEHGTKLFAANPDLAAQILNWLNEVVP